MINTTPVRRCIRRIVVFVFIIATVPAAASASPQVLLAGDPDVRILRVEQWLKAILHHEPGAEDDPTALVGSWSNSDLRTLWIDANVLARLMRNPKLGRFSIAVEGQARLQEIRYTTRQLRRLSALACAVAGTVVESVCVGMEASTELDAELQRLSSLARAARISGDENYILRRGALLHTDVAIQVRDHAAEPLNPSSSVGLQRITMKARDGRGTGLGHTAVHWDIARLLLDHVKPPGAERPVPGRDEMVREWYRATATWMQNHDTHETRHLDRARALFPADPDILFLSGCQHETYASALVQSAIRSNVLPIGVSFDVGSEGPELRRAETFFRRALTFKPDFGEAHLRLGRVLALQGRHGDAAEELRQAVASIADNLLISPRTVPCRENGSSRCPRRSS